MLNKNYMARNIQINLEKKIDGGNITILYRKGDLIDLLYKIWRFVLIKEK